MATCEICDEEFEALAYSCSYCEGRHCVDHRLPEQHDCGALDQVESPPLRTETVSSDDRKHREREKELRA